MPRYLGKLPSGASKNSGLYPLTGTGPNSVFGRIKAGAWSGFYSPPLENLPAQSNLVAFWDAADIGSWSGSGTWNNLVTSPADGAAQSAYDLQLGSTSGSDANDPTFVGTPGGLSSSEFWSLSDTTGFELPSNTTFTSTMHRSDSVWTLGYIIDVASDTSWYIASTLPSGSASNRGFFVTHSHMQNINAGGYPLQSWTPGSNFKRFTVSLDGDVNPVWEYSIDGTLTTPSRAPATDTSSTADRTLMIANTNGYGGGISGGKLYAVVLWNKRLSAAEVTQFNNAFAARFGY